MTIPFTPVEATLTPDRSLPVLGPLRAAGALAVPAIPASYWAQSSSGYAPFVRLTDYQASASLHVESGLYGLGSLQSDASTQYLITDYALANWNKPVPGVAGSAIVGAVFGVGFRVAIKVWSISSKVSISRANIAASTELGAAKSSYAISTRGLPLSELGSLASYVSAGVGSFDASAFLRVSALEGELAETMSNLLQTAQGGATLSPALLAVQLDPTQINAVTQASNNPISTSYALQSIWSKGYTLSTALKQIPSAVQPDIVTDVYQAVLQVDPPGLSSTVPSAAAKTLAKQMQFWGE